MVVTRVTKSCVSFMKDGNDTSMLARILCCGILVVVTRVTKSCVSFMKDGSCLTSGCSQKSTKLEIFSVTLLTLDTIDWIFVKFL